MSALQSLPAWLSSSPGLALVFKATLIVSSGWLVHFALRRANPRWRVLLWRGVAVGLVAAPLMSVSLPIWHVEVEAPLTLAQRETVEVPTSARPVVVGTLERPSALAPPTDGRSGVPPALPVDEAPLSSDVSREEVRFAQVTPAATPTPAFSVSWPTVLWCGYLTVVLLLLLRFWLSHRLVGTIRRHSREPPKAVASVWVDIVRGLGWQGSVQVRACDVVSTPLLTGVLRPVILLPTRMLGDSYRSELPAIFAHELNHLRNRDVLWNYALHLVSVALWFHPLVWGLHTAHAAACEEVSDAATVKFVGSAGRYSRLLARVAVELTSSPALRGVAMARTSDVYRRLQALKRGILAETLRGWRVTLAVACGLLALGTVSTLQFSFTEAQQALSSCASGDIQTLIRDLGRPSCADPAQRIANHGAEAETAVPALLECLRDESVKRRVRAARALGLIGCRPEAVVEPLMRLFDDPEGSVRWAAYWALSRMGPGGKAATEELLARAGVEESPEHSRLAQLAALAVNADDPIALSRLVKARSLRNLNNLDLSQAHLGDREMMNLLEWFPKLTHVGMPRYVTDAIMEEVAKREGLETIDLSRTEITDRGVQALAGVTSLRRVKWPPRMTAEGLEVLSKLPLITRLPESLRFTTLRAIDAVSNRAVTHARVRVRVHSNSFVRRLDAEGRLEIPLAEMNDLNGYLEVDLEMGRYVPASISWRQRDFARVPEELVFKLERGTSLGGRIENEEGEPVEDVRVNLSWPSEGFTTYLPQVAFTDADGRWRADHVPHESAPRGMLLEHPDYSGSESRNTVPVPQMETLRDFSAVMVLRRGLTLSGFVRDDQGKPIEDALVRLDTQQLRKNPKLHRTDKDGRFELRNCPADSLRLCAQAPGRSPQTRSLSVDEAREPVEFNLAAGHSIEIRVVDTAGAPVKGAWVSTESYNGFRYVLSFDPRTGETARQTDADGLVAWSSAPADAVKYAVMKRDFARLEVGLVADGGRHTVTLPRQLRVRVRAFDKDSGEPLLRFTVLPVRLLNSSVPPWVNFRDIAQVETTEYEYTLSQLGSEHQVRVEAAGYLPATSDGFRVGEVAERIVDLHLSPGENVSGMVRCPDGKPIAGAQAVVASPSEQPMISDGRLRARGPARSVKSDEKGRFSLPPQSGRFKIVAVSDSGFAAVDGATFRAAGEMTLQAWGRVGGQLSQGGQAVAGCRVSMNANGFDWCKPYGGIYYGATTDKHGRFKFDRVVPGKYTLRAVLDAVGDSVSSSQNVTVDVRPGENLGKVQVELQRDGSAPFLSTES